MEKLENAIAEIKKVFPGMKILENEPMRAHCSFRTGGPVRALAYPSDLSSLTKLCCILKEHELAPLMLGNCTNIVFPDEGMSEVFAICTEKLTKLFLLPDGAIYAECGVPLSRLAAFAQQNGRTYGLVILGSNSQNIFREAAELFDWAFANEALLHPAAPETTKKSFFSFWHKLLE